MEDLHIANISNHTSESWTFWKTYTRSEFPLDNGEVQEIDVPEMLKQIYNHEISGRCDKSSEPK